MADSPEPPKPEPTSDQVESAFLDKLEQRFDAWFDKKFPKETKPDPKGDKPAPEPTGTTRTGHKRVTLTGLLADAVFGPGKDE